MMTIIFIFIYLAFHLNQCIVNALVINAFTTTLNLNHEIYTPLVEDFNAYSKKNNLNITVNLEITENDQINDYYSIFEVLLKKKNSRKSYEIFFYENYYKSKFGENLMDLKGLIPEDHINMFDPNIISGTCYFKDKLIGIPLTQFYSVLFSNVKLLNQYNKPIPKTWDELIKTSKYILKQERLNNNTELIGYNGEFDSTQQGIFSLYEFIYSCRDSVNATYPEPKDPTFIYALKKLKELKEAASSDKIFQSDQVYTNIKLIDGKALFLKNWITLANENYQISNMPGSKDGISSSIITGINIGINKHIPSSKLNAAVEVIKYMTSKEVQKEYLKKGQIFTSIPSLWYDKDVCIFEWWCKIFRNLQTIGEPPFITKISDFNYPKKYQKYIYSYLFENKTEAETLKSIEDILKIYYVSLDKNNSYIGYVTFITMITISSIMLISIIFLFKRNYNPFFTFLSIDFWILTVLGSIILLWIPITCIENVSSFKCHLKLVMASLGLTLISVPNLYKLITNFPEFNNISYWVKGNKYLFLLLSILIDVLLNGISFSKPYSEKKIVVEEGESFQICENNEPYSIILLFIYKFIIQISQLLLIFIEWNIKTVKYDLKMVISTVYLNILFLIFLILFSYIMVYDYQIYFLINTSIFFLISISNYVSLYGIRLILAFFNKIDVKTHFISNINKEFIEEQSYQAQNSTIITKNIDSQYDSYTGNTTTTNFSSDERLKKSTIFSKMIYYHNHAEISELSNPKYSTNSRSTSKSNNLLSARSANKSNNLLSARSSSKNNN